ncbi:unnamed protein product [Prorocentrum cordatum]|uniref:F5/8 type C domain-containing protein n=1 Tax=Prorocentrum cordatum TaxID=2364126 RepID=A0ABN9W4T8_9DINO|nr:unnamed protein product [Polarella glacialis]
MLGGGRRGRRGRELRREPGAADVGGGARPAPPRPRRAGRSRGAGGLRRRRPRRRRPGRARAASPARGGERRDVRAWILLQGDDGNCTDVDDNQDYTAAADLEPICNVTGAADCRAECERMERCGAWTWGKVRGSLGLTDCCFPKVVGRSGKVRREANENVVSGFACRGGNAARYGELLSEAAPDVPTTAAYTEAGLELPKLTNGDFSTNDDGDYNRVDLNVSDSLVFDLGGDYDVTSISIAGGNAHLGGTETPKTIDIYTASSLDGPWVQSETLQYPTIVDNIDAAINAQRKDLPLELLRTRFVKLHFLDNHGNEHVAVRQVAFGGVESVNESVSEFVSTTTEVAEHHEPLTTTTDAAELNAPVTTTSAGIAPSSEDEVSAASLFDDVFRSFDDDEARDERDQAATAAGLSRHRRHPAAAGSGTADTTTAATLTGVPTADSATDLSTTTAADAVAAAPEPQGAAYAAGRPGRGSLYCFALMMPDTYEEALLLWQVNEGAGIFACDEAAVYSNTSRELVPAPGRPSVTTLRVNSTLSCDSGGEFGTALNLDIFFAVWDAVIGNGRYRKHDWSVKVDPDSVFFPHRLHGVLDPLVDEGRSEAGAYLNNCPFGMHGPVEVLSLAAVDTWDAGRQGCVEHFEELCNGSCLWGEDMFLDQCLQLLNATRVDDFGHLLEDHCDPPEGWQDCANGSAAAFHPYKNVSAFRTCFDRALEAGGDDADTPRNRVARVDVALRRTSLSKT